MKKILLLVPLLALAISCSARILPDDTGGGGNVPEEMTDEQKYQALIYKTDVEKITSGSVLDGVDNENLCIKLNFSDGKSFVMGKRFCSLVGNDTDGYVTVNGRKQDWRVADCPMYKLSDDGFWLKQGEKTDKKVFPMTPKDAEGTYVIFIEDNMRECRFHFSDGTSLSFPYPGAKKKMYVSKSASQMDVYMGDASSSEYIKYPFKKRYSDFREGVYKCFLDNWGVMALSLCQFSNGGFDAGTPIFLNGEAEMAVSVTDGADPSKNNYVGGVLHGFENIVEKDGKRGLTITVDGKSIAEDATLDLQEATKIVMTQSSDLCQAYTNTNPFAHAERVWTFENGRLTIKIELTLLRDMHFANGMFGMLCVLRRWKESTSEKYLTSVAVKDSAPLVGIDVKDGWGSMSRDSKPTRITEYGEMGWSFALCVDESNRKLNGGMFVGTNGNGYNKIYFDLTGSYDAKQGEVLSGQVHWEIERYY